ncbi:hypothetical protein Btru_073623 [Bulinus truncatus]|nr:hypothetical protein Btru_073623 [Bulinus truncatus]
MSSRESKTKKSQRNDIQISGSAFSSKSSSASSRDGLTRSGLPTPSPTEMSAVDQVMEINRKLVAQIETLRLKVEVDTRHHEKTTKSLKGDKESTLQTRDTEIDNLKNDLKKKDDTVKLLVEDNAKKGSEIKRLQDHIDELKEDVRISQLYADEIQKQLDQLKTDKNNLTSGAAYKEKDEDIKALQEEVDTLKKHLHTLEDELIKAKEKIAQQGARLRFMEHDKTNTQLKFKEELAKASLTMRSEVEKIRNVMHQQWEEMRKLREQNKFMQENIQEIKSMLLDYPKAEVPRNSQPQLLYGPSLPSFNNHGKKPTGPNKKR